MKDDYARLLLAAEKLRGWKSAAEVAARLTEHGYEVSEQTMTNWKSRGVSKEGRLKGSRIIGCRPHWLETGEGDMAEKQQTAEEPKAERAWAAYDRADEATQAVVNAILGVGAPPPWFDGSAAGFIDMMKTNAKKWIDERKSDDAAAA